MIGRLAIVLLGTAFALAGGPATAEEEVPAAGPVAVPPDPFAIFSARRAWLPVLDAVEPCLPAEPPDALRPVLPFVLEDRESATRRVLELAEETRRKEGEGLSADLRLWLAIAGARVADTAERRHDAIRTIDRALTRGGGGEARVCAYLERARAELRIHRAPEASASALRALREGEAAELPPARVEAARFLRAEALLLAGRVDDARSLYESLAAADRPGVAAASRLRLIESVGGEIDPVTAWKRLQARMEEARDADLDLRAFARVATEFALRAGDSRRALLHASRAADLEGDDLATGLAAIRKADVLAARDRGADAALTLRRLSEVHPDVDVRRLATIRLAVHGLGGETAAEERAVLEDAAASSERGLSVYARAVLLHRHVGEGEVDLALAEYARLAYDDPDDVLAPDHRDDLDAALRAAVGSHCPTTVRLLGGRRELFLRQARVSEPFVALADCYLALGMPVPALGAYRAVTRAFGPSLAAQLTLRLARASLGAGDLPAVRAALRAHREHPGEPRGGLAGDSWPLFEAELALREGREEAAAERLLSLVRGGRAPLRALRRLAELVARDKTGGEALAVLEDETSRWQLAPDPLADAEEAQIRAGIALVVADRLLARDETSRAHYYYGLAAETLADGPERARARFARARLSRGERRRRAFETAAEPTQGPALWNRLAGIELRAAELRAEIGRAEPTP